MLRETGQQNHKRTIDAMKLDQIQSKTTTAAIDKITIPLHCKLKMLELDMARLLRRLGNLIDRFKFGYRPENYYMRGAGPATAARMQRDKQLSLK